VSARPTAPHGDRAARRAAVVALTLGVAACGSAAPADLPAPAGPDRSPALTAPPAGRLITPRPLPDVTRAAGFVVDSRGDRLTHGARSVRTGREPVAVALADAGRAVAVLCGRARTLELYDAATLRRLGRASAGTGPARLATDGHRILYVTDVVGESLLVFHLRPRFELIRRVDLPGGPYAIAYDARRRRLWITLTGRNQLAKYAAGARPQRRGTFATVRAPDALEVSGGEVIVNGRQVLRTR
jgi:hypothetical protein